MRRAFLTWLSILFCAAFALTGALAYHYAFKHEERNAVNVMSARLNDLMSLINHSVGTVRQVVELNDAATIERTRALAEIIRLNPKVLQNQEDLQGLCNDLGAVRLCVTNDKGVVVAAVPEDGRGVDLHDDEQMTPFLEGLQQPGFELCLRPAVGGAEPLRRQYAGVHRADAPGLVQMEFRSRHEQMVRSAGAFGKIAPGFTLGKGGHILAFRGGEVMNKDEIPGSPAPLLDLPTETPVSITLHDEQYLAYAVVSGEFRLVGLQSCREMELLAAGTVWSLILSNLGLFAVMFAVVAFLLQKIVVSGICRINGTLGQIANGKLDKRVDENSYPEFTGLSTGINRMVDALRDYGAQERDRMRRELELARNIQAAALPGKFPAFPGHPEFDLYATCTQAMVVGGDFYDFFMPRENRICFLVADVSAYGIPAALLMMRCMSVIRGLARSGVNPVKLVTETNRSLCESNTLDMRVRLFYGSLDIKTGELHYVNAGPPQALLQHVGGEYEILPSESGDALGYMPGSEYTECRTTLQVGDRIFLYTAGAVDALNAENTPFGEARLQEALQVEAATPRDVLQSVRSSLRRFIGSSEPKTDITMFCLEYKGVMHTRASCSTLAGETGGVADTLSAPLESVFASPLNISDILASVHSILAALPQDCHVEIALCCNAEESEITLRYPLARFNPLISLPHLPVDHVAYRAEHGGSVLTLTKHLE